MTRRIIDLDAPDRFVALRDDDDDATTFYLQAARGARVVTVVLEREQVALLADRLLVILGELERRGLLAIEVRSGTRDGAGGGHDRRVASSGPIRPQEEEFRVGTLTIGWDNDASRIVVEAFAMVFDAGAGESALPPGVELDDEDMPDDDPLGPDVLRVRLTPLMALRFARRAGVLAG
jgi:uncharacterized repeat protein (TIGR03847 family)